MLDDAVDGLTVAAPARSPAGNVRVVAGSSARRRQGLLAVAMASAIVGVSVGIAIAPDAWTVDAQRNLAAARALVAGAFGSDHGYVYSPAAAALTVPWTWLPESVAIGLWLVVRAMVLGIGVLLATRGWPPLDRLLAGIAVVSFVPVLYDLMLGNVSILLAAAVALVAWRRDGWWSGILLGVALATIPKPQLAPVLLWMLVYRPRSLLSSAATAGAVTLVGLALLGSGPYAAWIGVLRSVDYLSSPMYGNLSLLAFVPGGLGLVIAAVACLATLAALARGSLPGLVACLALGMLVAPYTLAYAPVLLLVVARQLAERRPAESLVLALSTSIGVIVALPVWLAGVLVTALRLRAG